MRTRKNKEFLIFTISAQETKTSNQTKRFTNFKVFKLLRRLFSELLLAAAIFKGNFEMNKFLQNENDVK